MRVKSLLSVFLMAVLVAMGSPRAEEADEDWQPPPPVPDEFDWIQLKSGEWLKGEFKAMYNHELEFESDELGVHIHEWKDVHQVRTGRVVKVLLLGHITATGKMLVEGQTVRILGEEEQEFDRSRIILIVTGGTRRNFWSGSVDLGANYRSGNTDQVETNSRVVIKRRTVKNRIVLDYTANFNATNDVNVTNNHRVGLVWDKFLSDRFFIKPIYFEYYHDPFQNIDARTTVGVGVGYQIFDSPKTNWQVSGGPAFQKTRFQTVQAGENESETTPALTAETIFERDLTKSIEFQYDYSVQITNKESGSYNHHMKIGVKTEWTKLLDFDIFFVWDRIKDPQTAADLTVPEQDDFRLNLSLGIDF